MWDGGNYVVALLRTKYPVNYPFKYFPTQILLVVLGFLL